MNHVSLRFAFFTQTVFAQNKPVCETVRIHLRHLSATPIIAKPAKLTVALIAIWSCFGH